MLIMFSTGVLKFSFLPCLSWHLKNAHQQKGAAGDIYSEGEGEGGGEAAASSTKKKKRR